MLVLEKKKNLKINDLRFHLKKLEKEEKWQEGDEKHRWGYMK